MKWYCPRLSSLRNAVLTLLFSPVLLLAQQQPAGVVTAVQGQAQLTRSTMAAPSALRVKDGVIIRDVIDTREKSLARILFGGKATVTVRELTRFEVREETLPAGGTRSTIDLNSGAILVNVAKQLMKPGDEIQIRTPNAVAAVKGSAGAFEYDPSRQESAGTWISDEATWDSRYPNVCPRQTFKPFTTSKVNGLDANTKCTEITKVSEREVAALYQSFRTGLGNADETGALNSAVQTASALGAAATALTNGQTTGGGQQQTSNPPTPQTNPQSGCSGAGCGDGSGSGDGQPQFPPIPPKTGNGIPPLWESNFGPTVPALGCDDCGTVLALPFTFPYQGQNYTSITLSSNGFLFLGTDPPGGSTGTYQASVSEFLSSPQRIALVWSDLYTPGGGSIHYRALADRAVITWDGVPFYPFSSPLNSVQMQLFSNGRIVFSYLTLNPLVTTASNTALIGVTPGNGAADPGATDFGSMISFNTGSQGTVYEFFQGQGTQFGLDGMSIIFTPNGSGGWDVLVDDIDAFLSIVKGDVVNHLGIAPLVDFNQISLNLGGSFYDQSGGTVTLGGSLLSATNATMNIGSDPSFAADLVNVRGGGQIVLNGDAPLIQLSGGTLTIGTRDGTANNSPNHLIYVGGVNIDAAIGLGTDQPIRGNGRPVGTLLEATNGATIEVLRGAGDSSGGNALKLDTALLEATMPVIRLLGSINSQTSLTTENSTIDLIKSRLTSIGPVIALDRGLINVHNGALINLTSGSQLITLGDLLSLANGSRINVFNGPLINVAGAGSVLDVSGALVNFGGTGGNKIIVNNSIAPTATQSGLPVSATGGGSISIGPNPVKNPGLGNISVTGSLIQATNNGQVKIGAP